MDRPAPLKVVVLGGGTAGWMTAASLAKLLPDRVSVDLIESEDIGIIGVGEATLPHIRGFVERLGIREAEFMKATHATYKLGIDFRDFGRIGESYIHPFGSFGEELAGVGFHHYWLELQRREQAAPLGEYSLCVSAARANRFQPPSQDMTLASTYGYAYQFDATLFGPFMRDFGQSLGVARHEGLVTNVERDGDTGDVTALVLKDGRRIEGDLFVDCSGFRSLIAQQKLDVKFLPFASNLFNDRAVVMPTPHDCEPKPQTDSIAMRAGWRWRIPLITRVGNGYVYSSAHISDAEAEAELREALGQPEAEARFLTMKVGRVEETWRGNCLAAGLAQGFIEPLEATALHIVIATALEFAQAYEAGGFTPQHRDAFNASIAARYEGIRDYIVAHYRLGQRSNSGYWRANATNDALSDGLKAMMSAWFRHEDMSRANDAAYAGKRYYANASWHCLFAGYGTFPPPEKMQPVPPGVGVADIEGTRGMIEACRANFASYDPLHV